MFSRAEIVKQKAWLAYRGHVSWEAIDKMPRMVRLVVIRQIADWIKEENEQRSQASSGGRRVQVPKKAPSRGSKGWAKIRGGRR